MKSVVVYESFYGNTESVAQAIAAGLAQHGDSQAVAVATIDPATTADIDLLVVGAPTHAWGLPRARTRAAVASADASRPLLRTWLDSVSHGDGRAAAAFTTRLDKPRLVTGSAARGIARRLRRAGWSRLTAPRSFRVTGTEGPLAPGELAAATAWGKALAAVLAVRSSL